MQTGSKVKSPLPMPLRKVTANQSKSRVPTLTEMELYSISPERLNSSRRAEVANYMSEHFLSGEGLSKRAEADSAIRKKIGDFLKSR